MRTIHRGAVCMAMSSLIGGMASAQSAIPLRSLTTPVSSDSGLFTSLSNVRALRSGRVIVDDIFRRRMMLFDSTLSTYKILADTAPGAPNRYPNTFAAMMPYLGDSTLLIDREAQALVVIDPAGAFIRTMAAPKPADLILLQLSPGNAATDPQGRLVYRVTRRRPAAQSPAARDSGVLTTTISRDSAVIVRADFETRTVDSIATHAVPIQKNLTMAMGNGGFAGTVAFNPLPQTDEWVMLPDGTIAIVRGQDYHIDWVSPDGTRSSSPKMLFDWKRVTLEAKEAMLDSAKKAAADREARAAASAAERAAGGGAPVGRGGDGGGGGAARGTGGGGAVSVGGPPPAPGAGGRAAFPRFPFTTVDVADMPDYYPPIRSGTVKGDPEGNVWILPTTSVLSDGGLVYDVVNRKGDIVERVKLPPKRSLLAVGPGGVLYMNNSADGTSRLERARIIR